MDLGFVFTQTAFPISSLSWQSLEFLGFSAGWGVPAVPHLCLLPLPAPAAAPALLQPHLPCSLLLL